MIKCILQFFKGFNIYQKFETCQTETKYLRSNEFLKIMSKIPNYAYADGFFENYFLKNNANKPISYIDDCKNIMP